MDRFWDRVEPTGFCWNWTGPPDRDGYGKIRRAGKTFAAHRFAYELLVGPIPQGLQLDHLCRNRLCVNPDHLEPVTSAENTRRGSHAAGRPRPHTRRTHCKRGHELAGDNVYLQDRGTIMARSCLTCRRAR